MRSVGLKSVGMKERGIKILRCGAKRLASTFVDEDNKQQALLLVREGGHSASAPIA
jgi:hypothetical protein